MKTSKKANYQLKLKQMRDYFSTHSADGFIEHYAKCFCELSDKLNDCKNKCRRNNVDIVRLISAETSVKCLEEILHYNGIKPQRLIVRYYDYTCKGCPGYSPFYDDICDKSQTCEGHYVKKVEEISLYCMSVDGDGFLQGITTEFSRAQFDTIEILDANTGKTLWEGENNG